MKLRITAAAIALALAAPQIAAADAPLRDRFPVDATFDDPELSEACGVPVTIEYTGTFAITVFTDRDGQTVREIDTQPGTKVTYASATGSISVPFSGVLHAQYTDDAVVGSPATIAMTGYLPGQGTGRLLQTAVVVETEDGFVFTRFTGLLSESGNFTSQVQQICEALV